MCSVPFAHSYTPMGCGHTAAGWTTRAAPAAGSMSGVDSASYDRGSPIRVRAAQAAGSIELTAADSPEAAHRLYIYIHGTLRLPRGGAPLTAIHGLRAHSDSPEAAHP